MQLDPSDGQASRADDLVLQVDGVFDATVARRLEDALAHACPGARVRLDLSRVRELQDHGLALLARALAARAGVVPVALLGLRRHQMRLLRYLGVDPRALEPALAVESSTSWAASPAQVAFISPRQ